MSDPTDQPMPYTPAPAPMHDGRRPADAADRQPEPTGAFANDPRVPNEAAVDHPELRRLFAMLWRRRWMILATSLVTGLLLLGYTAMQPKMYRASATLQIDRETLKIVNFDGASSPVEAPGGGDEFYQTQYELLRSRSLAQRVALDLRQDGGNRSGAKTSIPAAASALVDGLVIEPVRNSRLVKVVYESGDPAQAARVSNAYANAFVKSTLERKFQASSYAKEFLEDRLAQLKERLQESERELVQFAQQEQIVSGAEGQSLSGQTLTEINANLARTQAERARAEARWRQAGASAGTALPSGMLEDSIVRTLQARRGELAGQYQQKLGVYKSEHPEMLALQSQIDELQRQINQELASIRAGVKAEYDTAVRQERLLTGQLANARGDELDLQNRSIRYNILKREVDTNRELYDGLLQRYKEIGVAGGVASNNVSIVDLAEVPAVPYKPSLRRGLITGLALGLLLAIALAFVLEHLDDTVRAPSELQERFGIPALGIVPALQGQSTEAAAADVRSAFSEAYRSVRTALQFSTDHGVPKVLLVTSASPSEGKSTTALALATNLARLGHKVLLIDADLRNPSLHRQFPSTATMGLSSYLTSAATIEQVVQKTPIENLSAVTSGPLPPNPAELLSGPRMRELLESAAGQFDQLVLDGPPVMGLADAPIVAHLADGTLLMVAAGRTRRTALQAALQRLRASRARVVGAVLTMYEPKHDDAGAYYGGYAYYGEKAGPPGR